MITSETLHHDHNAADINGVRALLEAQAENLAHTWQLSNKPFGKIAVRRFWHTVTLQKNALLAKAERDPSDGPFDTRPPDQRNQLIREHKRLIEGTFKEVAAAKESFAKLPQASLETGETQPRVFLVTDKFLLITEDHWVPNLWSVYLGALERHEPLLVREVWASVATLKLLLLRRIAHYSDLPSETNQQESSGSALQHMRTCIQSLERLGQIDFNRFLESLIPFDQILRQDPAGAYAGMDLASRQMYHSKVERIARRSDKTEVQVAQSAIALAKQAKDRSNAHPRETHVGYFLLSDGVSQLAHDVGYHPNLADRLRTTLRQFADEFYIGGVALITGLLIFSLLVPHISAQSSMTADIFALLLMIIPGSQSAVDLLNNLVSRIFKAEALPKMDYSSGVPTEFTTLVVIPTLLLSEKQIQTLVEDVEIRYLANQDRNIHFALLTDLADSVQRPKPNDSSPLVDRAVKLIEELNEQYRPGGKGVIFLLHRHRIFNQRQQVWMGWERKRGKLLDLNKLICGEEDAFPVKSRMLPDMRSIRYVITLDSDTQLPRGAAHRLIGAMAHPLNQPVIDTQNRIVRKGYGILQPRIDISVHSAYHSRLAALQSGETGMDPYSRAVSDVYQDLYGEAIFTGKGLYDVAVLHAVLNKRFPRNSLLSHDLIEGAYARVGLVSDVELVDDYPSHYSAWSRRKHRWVRGDWQTIQWLLNRVPNEQGKYVKNPISFTSQWRIVDNLRRSLVEIATLTLLLAGWFGLPGGVLYWTLATLALLFLPVYVPLAFSLVPALLAFKTHAIKRAIRTCVDEHGLVLLSIVFLPLQVMITVDAIFRANFRRFVSGERLLEWETAAQAELKSGGTPVDRYMLIMPVFSLTLAALLYLTNQHGLLIALPILLLWALTNTFVDWLNAKPKHKEYQPEPDQAIFLHNVALRTWRYYVQFSTSQNHWLIPDNVQEEDMRQAERISPTNVGLLLNARQAALEFGYLTLSEFAWMTTQTLKTVGQMPKYRGHLFNWHNTQTLEVMQPIMVTTVDSGNLAASLISLRMGCRDLLHRPMLSRDLHSGLRDHMQMLESLGMPWPARIINLDCEDASWIDTVLRLDTSFKLELGQVPGTEIKWWAIQTERRIHAIHEYVERYLPWLMPEYEELRQVILRDLMATTLDITPLTARSLSDTIRQRIQATLIAGDIDSSTQQICRLLLGRIVEAQPCLDNLILELHEIDEQCRRLVKEMDFTCLQNPERELLSIGYMPEEDAMEPSCFDLLASEARMAVFVAIAKGDIPQQTWFRMGRQQVKAAGTRLLLSWTGTMFEYLMPTLWMRSEPNTAIFNSISAAVQVQRWFAKKYRIPWGISESGYSDTDASGNFLYHAFGIPDIALKYGAEAGPIVSPYSTCLALEVDPTAALSNLKTMHRLNLLGSYGFYEAGDYRGSSTSRRQPECTLVRSWMVHHQGMSLLAICNLLRERFFQRSFHQSPMVQSTERLLYERPLLQEED